MALSLVVGGAALVLASCAGNQREPESAFTPSGAAPLGAGHPPIYQQPVKLTDGEYLSPAGFAGARDAASEAIADENSQPRFRGLVGGIRLYQFGDEDGKDYCGGDDFREFIEAGKLDIGYLPPGVYAIGPQYAAICPDNSVAGYGQDLMGQNFTMEVWWAAGEPAFPIDASEKRISEDTISGRPAVIVSPITRDGVGSSFVFVETDKGALSVTAHDLPLEETLKIVKGISCDAC